MTSGTTGTAPPVVGVIMGSASDWDTMAKASAMLGRFGVAHEARVVSAHRTPELMMSYAAEAESRGLEVVIAGAGGAAHLPGMVAGHTLVPVIGVPIRSRALNGIDSLLSIVQMPAGVPVATMAIGDAGATNAALLAISILSSARPELREQLRTYRRQLAEAIANEPLPVTTVDGTQ